MHRSCSCVMEHGARAWQRRVAAPRREARRGRMPKRLPRGSCMWSRRGCVAVWRGRETFELVACVSVCVSIPHSSGHVTAHRGTINAQEGPGRRGRHRTDIHQFTARFGYLFCPAARGQIFTVNASCLSVAKAVPVNALLRFENAWRKFFTRAPIHSRPCTRAPSRGWACLLVLDQADAPCTSALY